MNYQNFKNGQAKFPVSTETFDFMQEQIFLVARLAEAIGANVIIKQPTLSSSPSTPGSDGLIIVNGELLPFKWGHGNTIVVCETSEDITAGTQTFVAARTRRWAQHGLGGIPLSNFTTLQDMVQLMSRIAAIENNYMTSAAINALVDGLQNTLQTEIDGIDGRVATIENSYITQAAVAQALADASKHHLPKYTVIDWYGPSPSVADVPYGFVPCGWFRATVSVRMAWEAAYDHSVQLTATSNENDYEYINITNANGVTIPDLTDRFIVQAGFKYPKGAAGGEEEVTLTIDEMPRHDHGGYTANDGAHRHNLNLDLGRTTAGLNDPYEDSYSDYRGSGTKLIATASGSNHCHAITSQGGNRAHNNMPPYFALYKLIKVI